MGVIHRIKLLATLVLIALIGNQCRKAFEWATWDVELLGPIAYGKLSLENRLWNDEVGPDPQGLIHVHIYDTLVRIGIDTLIGIPDTTLTSEFSVPVGGIQWAPGVPFYRDTVVTRFDLKDAKLAFAKIRESMFKVKLSNGLRKQILVRYSILSATSDGDTFKLEQLVPAKSTYQGDYDVDGYDLLLTGLEGKDVNTISLYVEAMIDPAETAMYTFQAGESFKLATTFERIIPQYAQGFFGSQESHFSDTNVIELLEQLPFDTADITDYRIELIIDNGIGVDLMLTLSEISAFRNHQSVGLEHAIIGVPQAFGRAVNLFDPLAPVKHVQKRYLFDQDNSNIDDLFELKPSGLNYGLELQINPLGNISQGNDFVYSGHDLSAVMDLDVPLSVGFEGLVLNDTVELDLGIDSLGSFYQGGRFVLYLENGFPFGASCDLSLLDAEGQVVAQWGGGQLEIAAAQVDFNGMVQSPSESVLEFPVSSQQWTNLPSATRVVVELSMETYNGQVVDIRSDHTVSFRLVADIQVQTR